MNHSKLSVNRKSFKYLKISLKFCKYILNLNVKEFINNQEYKSIKFKSKLHAKYN